MKKKLTMKDIAEMANVSRMTVSRYINGGYVSEENRKVIKKIIETHDFTPNLYAQSLKKDLNIIGVILPTINSRTSNKLIKGILDAASDLGYEVIITSCEFDEEKELLQLQNYLTLRVRGIISLYIKADIYFGKGKNNSIVLIGQEDLAVKSITYPDEAAITEIIQEIIIPNLNRITKVVSLVDSFRLNMRQIRIRKLCEKLISDIKYEEVITENISDFPIDIVLEKGGFYICATDQIAYNLYSIAEQQGLAVGKDIFVTGFGDYDMSKRIIPPLTTVKLPYYQSGVAAVSKLLDDENATSITMGYTLIVRDSTPK